MLIPVLAPHGLQLYCFSHTGSAQRKSTSPSRVWTLSLSTHLEAEIVFARGFCQSPQFYSLRLVTKGFAACWIALFVLLWLVWIYQSLVAIVRTVSQGLKQKHGIMAQKIQTSWSISGENERVDWTINEENLFCLQVRDHLKSVLKTP